MNLDYNFSRTNANSNGIQTAKTGFTIMAQSYNLTSRFNAWILICTFVIQNANALLPNLHAIALSFCMEHNITRKLKWNNFGILKWDFWIDHMCEPRCLVWACKCIVKTFPWLTISLILAQKYRMLLGMAYVESRMVEKKILLKQSILDKKTIRFS